MKPNKDLYMECNDGKSNLNQQQFEEMFCSQCKNRECVRASWGYSTWDKRILTQVDRLIKNPNIVNQSDSSRWEGIVDLEVFKETQSEDWGSPFKVESPKVIEVQPTIIEVQPTIIEEAATPAIELQECPPPELISAPVLQPEPPTAPSSFNTPVQSINVGAGEQPNPTLIKAEDPWAVTSTVAVGGKFKMGS